MAYLTPHKTALLCIFLNNDLAMDLYIKTSSKKKKKRAKTEAWRQKKEKKSHPLILQLAGKLVFQLNALQFQEN